MPMSLVVIIGIFKLYFNGSCILCRLWHNTKSMEHPINRMHYTPTAYTPTLIRIRTVNIVIYQLNIEFVKCENN